MTTKNSHKLIQQAIKLHASGQLDQATRLYLQVLNDEPDNFDALHLSGAAALQAGDAAGAEELIKQALSRGRMSGERAGQHKRLGDAHNNLAVALQKQRKFDEALQAARTAMQYRSSDSDVVANTGLLLKELGQYEEAETQLRQAIKMNPRHVRARVALGLILHITDRRTEAERQVGQALQVEPRNASALTLRGTLLAARNEPALALESFAAALEASPDFTDALYNRALLHSALGKFGSAWTDIYKYHPTRRGATKHQPPLPARLDGKHVFINRNQGIGDELFYLRFVPLLKQRGARISYRTEERMMSFVQRLAYVDEAVPNAVKQFSADYIVLVDQLPYLLELGDADVPPSIRLLAKPDAVQRMALRLQQAGPPPYVGVTWRAGRMRSEVDFRKEATEILFKEIAPERLADTLRPWPGTLLVLQRNPSADELARFQQALGNRAVDCSDVNNNLEDMLALLSLIERYVTVSNTNLHLRAAAGLPSHVLVPNPPEWRWGFDGRSPWFPDCPVYRQSIAGDWQPALEQLGAELLR